MDNESERQAQPESTVAQSFAADLDSMFGLSTGTATLSQNVEEVKANVSSGQAELEELEARLRETEQRLAKVSRQNSPSRQVSSGAAQTVSSPLGQKPTYPDDRPPTGRQQPQGQVISNASNTRGQSNGREDYVMVDSSNQR